MLMTLGQRYNLNFVVCHLTRLKKTITLWVYSNDVALFQSEAKQTLITRLHEKEEDDGNDSPYSCSHKDVAETDGTQTSVGSSVHGGCSWSEQIINGTYMYLNAVFLWAYALMRDFLNDEGLS